MEVCNIYLLDAFLFCLGGELLSKFPPSYLFLVIFVLHSSFRFLFLHGSIFNCSTFQLLLFMTFSFYSSSLWMTTLYTQLTILSCFTVIICLKVYLDFLAFVSWFHNYFPYYEICICCLSACCKALLWFFQRKYLRFPEILHIICILYLIRLYYIL